jgi:hypothetical protein
MTLIEAMISSETVSDEQEAFQLIRELRQEVLEGADPEELLYDLGFEPEYVLDLLDY